MTVLSAADIDAALGTLDGWSLEGDQITKEFSLGDFRQAIAFVVRAAFEAESANHHPDIDIRYSKVTVGLTTHSEGGITEKDVEVARAVQALA